MKRFISIVFALFLGFTASNTSAQTLHALIFCNTIDPNIGEGMKKDMANIKQAIQTIAACLDCELELEAFDGAICTKENVIKCIDEMEVGRDDVVFFYYSGHGSHAINDSDPFPQMCMNTNIESLWLPVAKVDKLLANKQPKLRIIITDCCNVKQQGVSIKPLFAQYDGATSLNNYNVAAFRKLFLNEKGKVIMTSSKLGEPSWCNSENGGLFTCDFIDILDGVGHNRIEASWESVCKNTHDKTFARVIPKREPPFSTKQEPYYVTNTSPEKDPGTNPHPYNNTETLFKALQTLVNKNLSVDARLKMMPAVLKQYFSSDAKVKTVGYNNTTIVDYEDAEVFLQRIILSPYIKQINIINGNINGKNSEITVHEVRTN